MRVNKNPINYNTTIIIGNVSGANQGSCANPCKPIKKVSKNSEKNHECASQLTSSIYKILWSNSSYSKSYKKDKFSDNNNGSNASQICLFFLTSRVRRI